MDRLATQLGLTEDGRPPAAPRRWTVELAAAIVREAEALLASDSKAAVDDAVWHAYLEMTRYPEFLQSLPDRDWRNRWAETTFGAIDRSDYSLLTLLQQRTRSHADHILFHELSESGAGRWSYAQVARRLQITAAALQQQADGSGPAAVAPAEPRVAIWAENSLGSACVDLACLAYGIFVTPLNVHFGVDVLAWIFQALGVNTVVTDTVERAQRLSEIRASGDRALRVITLGAVADIEEARIESLDASCAGLTPRMVAEQLRDRPGRRLHDVATVMFTSGSTGRPKGVAFSGYNLVTKRFARAAALPGIGQGEVLLCYLPLYHTFGRYLEMLGALFWGGTYTFAGNPSAETLLTQLQEIRPTGLIGIPLRWQQIRDHCLARMEEVPEPERQRELMRATVGARLRWGLSAAGYLDPKVFHFFNRHGVDLCSGFGMTEATGGITMTPPGDYRDDSVGIPLPGIRHRFSAEGELQIAGPYIARYLEDLQPQGEAGAAELEGAAVAERFRQEYWLATGDLFQEGEGGHLSIVDRLKDIYKNTKGQTIAPRSVEQKFAEVPGIARAFLVGDGRAYNVLLIVPDRDDPVLKASPSPENTREYFRKIITIANRDLAPYERVIDFALLDRDFSLERGELTPKGSYRRKNIEASFRSVIEDLYRGHQMELVWSDWRIQIPRWFYRDLSILQDDILVTAEGLCDRRHRRTLWLRQGPAAEILQIGSLEYRIGDRRVDLGTIVRQPLAWAGNPELVAFCRCKTGWDTPLGSISEQVSLPAEREEIDVTGPEPSIAHQPLAAAHLLCQQALFGPVENARAAVRELGQKLAVAGDRLGTLIRRRLEALARHPDHQVRCHAYQILVLDEPVLDYNKYLPAFIDSGLTFLSPESIAAIARSHLEPRRLQALRKRLHNYRSQLDWPTSPANRRLFEDLFRLLADHARYHPEHYAPVREELVSWILHEADSELAAAAAEQFQELADWFEAELADRAVDVDPEAWKGKIAFQDGLTEAEIGHLEKILVGTTFLKQSVMLIFEGESFDLNSIGPAGIWISRLLSLSEYARYRVSINDRSGKHFDLVLIVRLDFDRQWVSKTIYWLIATRGYPYGAPVVPRFGCARPGLGAISQSYASDLTVWEKIREFSSVRGPGTVPPTSQVWRKLFVRAMATVLTGWRNSGGRIVPGAVNPTNIVVMDPDYRQGDHIQSLTGWKPYEGPLSLMRPLIRNFYLQTASHYPWCRHELRWEWICDACTEALGVQVAMSFLAELAREWKDKPLAVPGVDFAVVVEDHIVRLRERYYMPLAVESAIDRYRQWLNVNSDASPQAKLQTVEELMRLYRLDRHGEIARYAMYRNSYFADAGAAVQELCDRLLHRLFQNPKRRATQLVELSDLQAMLDNPDDSRAFRRLAFPQAKPAQRVEVRTIGEQKRQRVIVHSVLSNRHGRQFTVREPTDPAEVGQLYRLFLTGGFAKTISPEDRFFIAVDEQDQICGGVCYRPINEEVVHLDGLAVAHPLREHGIGSALLEDFCTRMADQGYTVVKTHFYLRNFFQRRGFKTDRRWGGLVRTLKTPG